MPIFFGDMAKFTWPGQFNLDFTTFLMLSGLWVAWRHHFSASGLILGAIAVVGGMLFLVALPADPQLQDRRRCEGPPAGRGARKRGLIPPSG